MTKRIFRAICMVAVLALLASTGLIFGLLYSYFTQLQTAQLRTETNLAAQGVAHEGLSYLEDLETSGCRITWIGADGSVLFDNATDSSRMENHLAREEVTEAIETGYGESTRYSDTIMEQSFYSAQQLPDGSVLRLSITQSSVLMLLLDMAQPFILILLLMLALALFLASRLAKKIVQPMNALDLDDPLSNKEYPELAPLLQRIDSQQIQLRAQSTELKRKQRQFDAVTASMNEGLVLLDNKATILSINPAASRLLGVEKSRIGTDFLAVNHSGDVCEVLYSALNGKKAEKTVQLPTGSYQLITSPVRVSGVVSGVVLLLFDVTERQKAEALRREFTANVSHELKTPLHAISGYAELMKSGMMQPGDLAHFSERIYSEAQRMIRLVEDILRLSRLDEGGDDMTWAEVDLYDLARQTIQELTAPAELAGVRLCLEGENVRLRGIPQLLSGILFNLTDNGIKYNHSGGSVTISIAEAADAVRLSVSDTGIGIPAEHRERIFERFYRVDKSHSKEVGGTGLGLSIVKHAALIHNAAIELDSTEGKGTTITVSFPK